MDKKNYNICQVSLNSNIPLIKENFLNFKRIYKNKITFHIICPNDQLSEFKEKLSFEEINIINENQIVNYDNFKLIYDELSKKIDYREKFNVRLKWYYQQVLKLTFALNFIKNEDRNIIIWDADTIILKKIIFFKNDKSIKYGNFYEFHKEYYKTNKKILGDQPNYFISFLNQFIAISRDEGNFFINNYLDNGSKEKLLGLKITKLIFSSIFETHKVYEDSLFSEYELIGQVNKKFDNCKQKPILFLRFGIDGKLNKFQIFIAKIFGFRHLTYEHNRINEKNFGMLSKRQSWKGFLNLMIKNLTKFFLGYIKYLILYNLKKNK